jgi:Streptomycin adenylyltransferase
VERLIAYVAEDGRLVGLYLGGSHAAATADQYSDLDLTLITSDDGWESIRDDREVLFRGLGDVLFLEEHTDFGFLLILFIYADGVRGEASFAPARDFNNVIGGPNIALVDKSGLLAGYTPHGLDKTMRQRLVRRTLVWFWYDRGLLDVFLARNRLWTAHRYLERCRERCLDLAWLRDHPEVWPGGHEKAELLRAETLEQLRPSVVPLERDAIASAARVCSDVYMELGAAVARANDVEFPSRLAGSVGARLGL